MQRLPGEIRTGRRHQIQHGGRDVGRFAETRKRNPAGEFGALRVGECARHVGVDEARRHGVYGDVAAGDFAREGFGEADQSRLGRGVVRLPGVADRADDGGDADDAPVALLGHVPQTTARQSKHGGEIGRDHLIPIFGFHAQQQTVAGDAGIVDEDARQLAAHLEVGEQGVDRFGRCNVDAGTATAASEPSVDGSGACGRRRGTDDARTGLGESLGDRATDAARGARHQCHLSLQIEARGNAHDVTPEMAASKVAASSMA